MKLGKQIGYFILFALAALIAYLLLIGVYTKISSDPIIFIASICLAVVISIIICLCLKRIKKVTWDTFTILMVGIVYFMEIIIVAIFGPTFIDRSISYHVAFYAVEKEKFYMEDIEDAFSKDIFEKRMHDALVTGFVVQNDDGSLSPTMKAKIMYYVLEPIGELTGSLDTYCNMKKAVETSAINE